MTTELETMLKPKPNQPTTLDQESQHLKDLVELFWLKVFERHRNTTQAFRFFDTSQKGKLKKSHIITGLERLRVRLTARDFDLIWEYLDP